MKTAFMAFFVCTQLVLAQNPVLNPDLACQGVRSNEVVYEVDFRAIVTAPYHTKRLRVWLPIPPSDEIQKVNSKGFSTFPENVSPQLGEESKYGNRFAYFEFDHPQGAQIIQHTFSVTTAEVRWNIDPSQVKLPSEWPSGFDKYLNSDRAVAVNSDILTLANQFKSQGERDFQKLTLAMNWLNTNMTYNHSLASLQASSLHAISNKQGHCSDYHGLCSAFGRVLGFPTRVTYGLAPMPKNSPSHCKLEAFLPKYGWVSFDISETQKLIERIQKEQSLSKAEQGALIEAAITRLHSGFRDNTWILQTRGTDYDLVPPASEPVNVVRTIYAEADGVALAEPDPSDITKTEFSWMTSHRFQASREVDYPFEDWTTLNLKKTE